MKYFIFWKVFKKVLPTCYIFNQNVNHEKKNKNKNKDKRKSRSMHDKLKKVEKELFFPCEIKA